MSWFQIRILVVSILWLLESHRGATLAPIHINDAGAVAGQFLLKVMDGYVVADVTVEMKKLIKDEFPSDSEYGHISVLAEIEDSIQLIVAELDPQSLEVARGTPGIEYIEEDGIVLPEATEEVDTSKYGLDRINQRGPELDQNYTIKGDGFGVNIYVVDSGVQDLHREFECRAEFRFDAREETGYDCTGHGTAVASVAAGTNYGVASAAMVHSIRVLGCDDEVTAISHVIIGIDWVVKHVTLPCVVTLALSSGESYVFDEIVQTLNELGCVVVAAAGNLAADADSVMDGGLNLTREACIRSPARSSFAITVGATNQYDTVPDWSRNGLCVDIFAPGDAIYAASHKDDETLLPVSGTSMSTAYVAGVAAIHLADVGVANGFSTFSFEPSQQVVKTQILRDSTTCAIEEAGLGSPNRILYTVPE